MPADYEHHVVCSVQFSGTEDYYMMFKCNGVSERTNYFTIFIVELLAPYVFYVHSTYYVWCIRRVFKFKI